MIIFPAILYVAGSATILVHVDVLGNILSAEDG